MEILTPTSIGELYDKYSILEIKMSNIKDEEKLTNISKELEKLQTIVEDYPIVKVLYNKLKLVNEKLWKIEDDIRECERQKDFGENFIRIARSVYFTNDERCDIKKKINIEYGSDLIEEKSYEKY